jgi:hypothetical protein
VAGGLRLGRSFKKLSIHVTGDVVIGTAWGFDLDYFFQRAGGMYPGIDGCSADEAF